MVHRVWIPSPNYSSSRAQNRLLVVHTSEGATTFQSLGNFLSSPSAGVSYQVGFDNDHADQIGEYVKPPNKAWAAFDANNWGEHGCCCTPSGASSGWSRDVWLSKGKMLDACKAWLQEESGRYGIPLVKINAGDINAGRSGVCGHGDISASGVPGGHTDPGPNFPWDRVVSGAPVPPPAGGAPPSAGAPPWPGIYLRNFTTGGGTRQWQQQMANRGWTIAADDMYGNQSEGVCRQFQAEKNLGVDGIVGPITWDAAWTAPIT